MDTLSVVSPDLCFSCLHMETTEVFLFFNI
jgi:hypothetical protein